jgi:hypothetical protein
MKVPDEELDQLYQGPPDSFIARRNDLAKKLGKDGAAVRALVKPQLAAWAANQVYWRNRVQFDRLVKASEALRAAHRRIVEGAPADLAEAERAHRDAVSDALDAARQALRDAGEPASPATIAAVADTLRALPTPEPFGRLARPLTPATGLEALAGLAPRAVGPRPDTPRPPALALVKRPTGDAAAARKEAARLRTAVERATTEARDAESEVRRLARAVERAESTRAKRQEALDAALAEVRALADDLARAREAHEAAAHERDRLARRLAVLES